MCNKKAILQKNVLNLNWWLDFNNILSNDTFKNWKVRFLDKKNWNFRLTNFSFASNVSREDKLKLLIRSSLTIESIVKQSSERFNRNIQSPYPTLGRISLNELISFIVCIL